MTKMRLVFLALFSALTINGFAQNDSIFVAEYIQSYFKKHKRAERIIERRHALQPNKYDLIIIPTLYINETIKGDWDYLNPENNHLFATWSVIDVRHMRMNDYIILSDTTQLYYRNTGYDKRPSFSRIDSTAFGGAYFLLLSKIWAIQPDYIFRLGGDPNWFFIKGNKVFVFERHYETLLYYDDAIEYLKQLFTKNTYWPPFYHYTF